MIPNYTLVTLNQLDNIPEGQTLTDNDLLYTLRYAPDDEDSEGGYLSEGNKISLAELVTFTINSDKTGTAIKYNAGTNGGNVLLLPEDGIIEEQNLPIASATQKGIVSISDSNLLVENGDIHLKSELEGITSITTDSDFNLSIGGGFIINGENVSKALIHDKIIKVENSAYIQVNQNNGIDTVYYLKDITKETLEAADNKITLNLDNIRNIGDTLVSIKVILRIPEGIETLILEGPANNFVLPNLSERVNALNIINIDILPNSTFGENYIILGDIKEITNNG